jgi:NADPH:quinone reductase
LERYPKQHQINTERLLALYKQGAIRPLVSERFSLDRGGAAIQQLADRKAVGKLVVVFE